MEKIGLLDSIGKNPIKKIELSEKKNLLIFGLS